MCNHLFVFFVRIFRARDVNNLHLIKLMQSIKTAYVSTPASCFPPEAWRIASVAQGEITFGENHIPIEIGDGDLCCRNEIEVVGVHAIHLTLLIRKLTGTVSGGFIYENRRLYFRISLLRGLVKEKVYERALKLCSFSLVNRKAGARKFHTKVEVDDVVLLDQFPRRDSIGGQLRNRPSLVYDNITVRSGTIRNILELGSRYLIQESLKAGGRSATRIRNRSHALLEVGRPRPASLGFVLSARLHQFTDFASDPVRLRQQLVVFLLGSAPVLVQGKNLVNGLLNIGNPTFLQGTNYPVPLFSDH